METMHAAGRRNLPPVPRAAAEPDDQSTERLHLPELEPSDGHGPASRPAAPSAVQPPAAPSAVQPPAADDGSVAPAAPVAVEPAADRVLAEEAPRDQAPDAELPSDELPADRSPADDPGTPAPAEDATPREVPAEAARTIDPDDPAQDFVARLRAAATEFAAAAGAENALVREVVPPARHRRARCRVVLRYADGGEADLTFVGAVGRPGSAAWVGFDEQIQRWLGDGQRREPAWLVEDDEAVDGVAVDVPAWLAAG